MALLGLFAKRDKPKPASVDKSSTTSTASASTDNADRASLRPSVHNSVYSTTTAASSSKLLLAFRHKKPAPPPGGDPAFLRVPPRYASARSDSGHDFLGPPPSKAHLFAAYADPAARSTRSLPASPTHAGGSSVNTPSVSVDDCGPEPKPPPAPPKKAMFSWAHRERKKSKPSPAPAPTPTPDDGAFNLRAFRHVRPASPGPPELPLLRPPSALSGISASSLAVGGTRPRAGSFGSASTSPTADSPQRISVAAFREMAARRSAANSPLPSPSPSSADVGREGASRFGRPPSALARTSPPAHRTRHRRAAASTHSTSSEPDSDSDADSGEDSAGSSTVGARRNRTITPRSAAKARSELGHRAPPHRRPRESPVQAPAPARMTPSSSAQSNGSGGRDSVYSRARASVSTSALMPSAAAKRASMLAAANKGASGSAADLLQRTQVRAKDRNKDSATSSSDDDSSDSDEDSDDAPLSRLVQPRRPGSAASSATAGSRARVPARPLIDIAGLTPPPPLVADPERAKALALPVKNARERERAEREETRREGAKKETQKEEIKKEEERESEKEKEASSSPVDSKPSINDRLARLALGVGAARAGSGDALQKAPGAREDDDREKAWDRDSGARKLPTRSQTAPADTLLPLSASPTPPASPASASLPAPPSPTATRKPNGRSLSTPDAGALVGEGVKDFSDPPPIVPTPIRERSPPPAFSVTSRPASQTQFASAQGQSPYSPQQYQYQLQAQQQQQQQQQHQQQAQQPTVRMISSPPQPPPSPPALPAGKQPLIPDGGIPPSKGFTGGGLLASATANPTVPSNPPAPALRAARHRAATASQASDAPREDQPQALRPFARPLGRTGSPARQANAGSGSGSGSGATSSSASSLSLAAPAQPAAKALMGPRQRSSTVASPGAGAGVGSGQGAGAGVGTGAGAGAGMGAPPKPFAGGLRGNSPASSTGESSSGRTPVTPVDGSEVSYALRDRNGRPGQGQGQALGQGGARRAHKKSASVTFDEPDRSRDRDRGRVGRERELDREREERAAAAEAEAEEARRKERRRSEAKAALEPVLQLGKIVNGHGPIADDDDNEEDRPHDNMPPRMSMMPPMMGMPGAPNMTPPSPMAWQSPQAGTPGMLTPQQFMFPMMQPNADPAFLAAHQQAMMFAKQAYQMAVAQQAMAAAEEEWERGSTVATSILGGGRGAMSTMSGMGGMTPMFPQGGFGMGGMGMGMGMQGGWGGSMMFPNSARSMYAGSVAGSELGAGARSGWGSRSAYGEPTGFAGGDRASTFRTSQFGFPQQPPVPQQPTGQTGGQPHGRSGPRPRTRTAPTGPPSEGPRRPPPPPSSWKAGARAA
ncbi:hypothetical protein AcW2_000110 [Taiwanofungus camphoratus]|nr:hypothetical protein AcW2_000110 [Antrodia cinnamomea]